MDKSVTSNLYDPLNNPGWRVANGAFVGRVSEVHPTNQLRDTLAFGGTVRRSRETTGGN